MNSFLNTLKTFFAPPVFEGDEEKTRAAKLLHQITMAVWSLPILGLIVTRINSSTTPFVMPAVIIVVIVQVIIMLLNHAGKVNWGSRLLIGMMFTVFTYLDYATAGTRTPIIVLMVVIIIMSGLLLGKRAPMTVAALLVAQYTIILILADKGIIRPQDSIPTVTQQILSTGMGYFLSAYTLQLAITRLQLAANRLREDEAQLELRNRELEQLSKSLEQRVADRTKALETSAEVSRRLASILDPTQLAGEVVNQIQSAFNYYYTQIYLFDPNGENLVLTAGTGEAGAVMMKRGHSLSKGRGLVGRAAENNLSVLVSDTSQAADWLPNELLPDTKAEAAIPITIGDRVLGVLDVQDNVTNEITSEDITLLESLASQVAISLQNAGLYAKADAALQEAQSLVDNAPEAIVVVDLATGLFANPNENAVRLYGLAREDLVKVGPAQMSPPRQPDGRDSTEKAMEKIGEAMQGGTPIFEWMHRNGQGDDFLCEVRLVRLPGEHPRVRASVTDISERKRNEDLTRRRAQQQEALNLITQKIQSATTIESALQVTARELGRALGMKPTLVTLEPDSKNGESQSAS